MCFILVLIIAKGCFVAAGHFVLPDVWSPDILSRRTLCPAGHFVPPNVLSDGRFVRPRLGRRTFFRRTFCPSGRFVAGRFVWAPSGGNFMLSVGNFRYICQSKYD
jgi:hypothetical protein